MATPVICVIDDDKAFLQTIEDELKSQYADRFQIISALTGDEALALLKKLKVRNETLALILAKEHMEQLSGTQVLQQTISLFPKAKRVLLVDYEERQKAIQSLNQRIIDNFVICPCNPSEEELSVTLNGMLDDWLASFRPPLTGLRLIGHRWSSRSYRIRDFLSRNLIPYQWLDIEQGGEATRLLEYIGGDSRKLPVVIFADGSYLVDPTNIQIAEKIDLQTQPEKSFYDLIIIGSGPAGLGAAVYGASEGLRTLMVEKKAPGGQAGSSSRIENYLGFPAGLSGAELSQRAVAQATRFGTEILTPQEAVGLRIEGQYRFVRLADDTEIACHALLIATGVSYRKLDVPGIEALNGRGIYYGAATTEGIACRDEEVYIVGGANSAGQAAVYFSRYARKVTMLVRANSLSAHMSHYLVDQIQETENIEVCTSTSVVGVKGEHRLEAITIKNTETNQVQKLPASSLFIFIGAVPHTDWLGQGIMRDSHCFILTGPDLLQDGHYPDSWPLDRNPYLLETSVPGIFAAGDVRHGSIKRVASSVGEGAMAVQFIERYLNEI